MKKVIIIGAIVFVLLIVAGGVGFFLLSGGSQPSEFSELEGQEGEGEIAEEAISSKAIYHEFHPNFVVNITDKTKTRYLQVDLAAVADKQSHIDALKEHMPAIRNDLIILFSSQEANPLKTQDGKEKLRKQALNTVQKVMQKKYGDPAVQEVYFNKFVIQ